MGCGCGGGGSAPSGQGTGQGKWSLILPNGSKQQYDTETAAKAANGKIGNKGIVRPVR